jgi:hypothetical protein
MPCHRARACGGLALLFFLSLSLGCSSGTKARAVVKGKVSIGEKHLTAGNIFFEGANNVGANATIDKDGNYEMGDAPIGDMKVWLTVPKVNPAHLAKMQAMRKGMPDTKSVDPSGSGMAISIMGEMPDNIVPIPEKYSDPNTSGLTYTVQPGAQTKDFVLTP